MDSSEWELSKENVQPIKQGRKIPNLTAALTPCGVNVGDDSLYWRLQKYKQNFEAEIRTYEGDDFLDVWYRYILWTEENVPKGGRDIGTLLERCIKEFQDVTKYENDERYLNVWLKYANCCSDPLEIFNYLHTKGTCSGLALLYVAWASACENVENFQKADQVLILGINKNAQPMEMLQKYHTGFQHRLTAHIVASQENQSESGQENQRKALGSLMSAGSKKMVGVFRASSMQNPAQSRSGLSRQEKKGLGFSILQDSDDNENRISRLTEGRGNDWKEAPMESVTSKENVNMPGKWTGDKARLKRPSNSTVARPTPKQSFQVHIDEDAEQVGHVRQTVGSQVLSVRKSDPETSNNPLKVLHADENSGPSNVKVMYDKSKVYAGAEEFQFEEIRAAKYMAKLKQGLPLRKDINRMKEEQNRPSQPEKKERVMYPKDQVYAYEGEFQLEEVMAKLYYERGNRLRIPNTCSAELVPCPTALADIPVPVQNNYPQHTANVTLRASAKKLRKPQNAESFCIKNFGENISVTAQDEPVSKSKSQFLQIDSAKNINVGDDVENIPPPIRNPRYTIPSDEDIPLPSNTQYRHDAENISPSQCDTRSTTIHKHKRDISPPTLVQSIDADNIPPPRYNTRGLDMRTDAGSLPSPCGDVENIHIYRDAENIPPPHITQDANIRTGDGGEPPPSSNVQNIHIYHDAKNIPPRHNMNIPTSAGGILPPSDGDGNIHIYHDPENIPPRHKARSMNIPTSAGSILPPNDGDENIHIYHDAENIPPRQKSRSVNIPTGAGSILQPSDGDQNIHIYHDAENIPPRHKCRSMNLPTSAGGILPPSDGDQHIHIYHDAENTPPPHYNTPTSTLPNRFKDIFSPSEAQNINTENIPPSKNSRGLTLRDDDDVKGVSSPGDVDKVENIVRKDATTPDARAQLREKFLVERGKSEKKNSLAAMTPKFAHYKPDLTGPSPTLTTKEAFADVMPWFNTTVGLSASDDELENDFKNDENDGDNDGMGWCGIPFGERYEQKYSPAKDIGNYCDGNKENLLASQTKKVEDHDENWLVSTMKEADDYGDENQENLPPFGYSQTKVERPVLGILQPSVGIPFEALEDLEQEEEMGEDDEQVNKPSLHQDTVPFVKQEPKHADDEVTRNNWLNHSEFAAAARLMSTPFEENLSPPKLENLHCSSIQAHDEKPDVSENASNVSSSYNANNSKGLSPILECSDEDGKSGSSKGSSHVSGLLGKSNVQTTHSVIVDQTEANFGQDTAAHTSELHARSMDITVHDMNGTVLKKINPFDPELCHELLSQLSRPVTSFPGYHDLKGNILPKFAPNNSVVIGEEIFIVYGIVGSGAYGKVFSAVKEDSDKSEAIALKVQRPANDWEFYISSELLKRMKNLGKSVAQISCIVNTTDYYACSDGSCSVTEYHKRGTFLDFVNDCKRLQNVTEETASFYAVEMMKILECIHECGIIHGDIKPDNFVLLENTRGSGEVLCRLGLIDFGCAIDVKLFPPGTRFSVDKNTESFECIEMKTQRPWTTQVDTYGMLCCLHCLIFGEYLKVYQEKKTGRWKATKSFNRTWNRVLWKKLFDVFLNIPSCDHLPSLAAIRREFQDYFQMDGEESTCDLRGVFF